MESKWSKHSGVKTDQYGDYFVVKGQSFHVFYDVFCEFRQVKNNRRVNRDLVAHLIADFDEIAIL